MAIEIKSLKRVFKYKDMILDDPNSQIAPEDVLRFYTGAYPELVTGSVKGPEKNDDTLTYEFKPTLGTKG